MRSFLRELGLLFLVMGASLATVSAQDSTSKLKKPDKVFLYPQLNLAGGYDTAESGDHWGLADLGARTQVTMEMFVKDETRIQRGYTRLIEPIAWNVKFALEAVPENGPGSASREPKAELKPRLLDTWVKLDTKWDRTAVWLGHKSLPYGHNPRLDPSHSFLPNQSGLDLSFGRDTGLFLKTPLSQDLDIETALTLGKGDTFDYQGGWLSSTRIGTPTYRANEIGGFLLAGEIQGTCGGETVDRDLRELWRVGVDWVHKEGEVWKSVNQLSIGQQTTSAGQDEDVLHLLNSVEWFAIPRFTLGLTHTLRHIEPDVTALSSRTLGRVLGSLSFAIDRDTRLRINPFYEYRDSTGREDYGVLLQVCFGCGLTK